jgi:hypothetical protein
VATPIDGELIPLPLFTQTDFPCSQIVSYGKNKDSDAYEKSSHRGSGIAASAFDLALVLVETQHFASVLIFGIEKI